VFETERLTLGVKIMSSSGAKFLFTVFFLFLLAVSTITGIAINLALTASIGWSIATVGIVAVVIFGLGMILGSRFTLFAFTSVALITAIVWLITHMHISF
jgi:hypothetical protein